MFLNRTTAKLVNIVLQLCAISGLAGKRANAVIEEQTEWRGRSFVLL